MARGCPRPRRGTKGSFLTAVGAWLAGALPMQSPPPSPEPQAAQGAPGLAVAGLEDCVYLSVAALQEGTAALRRWRARPSYLHGPQHRGRLGPGAQDRPRQPRPGGGGDSRSAVRRVLGGGAHIRYPAGTTLGDDSGWRPRPPALGAERGGALEEANTQSRRGPGKTRAPSAPPA